MLAGARRYLPRRGPRKPPPPKPRTEAGRVVLLVAPKRLALARFVAPGRLAALANFCRCTLVDAP